MFIKKIIYSLNLFFAQKNTEAFLFHIYLICSFFYYVFIEAPKLT